MTPTILPQNLRTGSPTVPPLPSPLPPPRRGLVDAADTGAQRYEAAFAGFGPDRTDERRPARGRRPSGRREARGASGSAASEGGEAGGGHERWLLTYADMITLLVAFFILQYALVVAAPRPADRHASQELLQTAVRAALLGSAENGARVVPRPVAIQTGGRAAQQRLWQRLNAWIGARHLQSDVRVEREPGGIVIRLDSGDAMLFATGTAQVQPRAALILNGLFNALVPEMTGNHVRAVRVAGHSDNQPVAPGSPWQTNWQLSAARAAGVAAYLAAKNNAHLAGRLEATGYGESRPVASNQTPQGRRRNRRVEIRVLLADNNNR